ncbi:unnamed protein product [Diplocarpon coronariae]
MAMGCTSICIVWVAGYRAFVTRAFQHLHQKLLYAFKSKHAVYFSAVFLTNFIGRQTPCHCKYPSTPANALYL